MQSVNRDYLKQLYKKVKHLRLPSDLEEISFESFYYYGWIDESDDICYLITEIDGKVEGIRGEILRMPSRILSKHMCSICHSHREFHEIMLFTAKTKTKNLPKDIAYRVAGVYICKDFIECNKSMKNGEEIVRFVKKIIG